MVTTSLRKLDSLLSNKEPKFTYPEIAQFIFFEKGIGYEEFCNTPIPYIVKMLEIHRYKVNEENKATKKANKGRT